MGELDREELEEKQVVNAKKTLDQFAENWAVGNKWQRRGTDGFVDHFIESALRHTGPGSQGELEWYYEGMKAFYQRV